MKKHPFSTVNLLVIPLQGILLFLVLYFIAAGYYPGGSEVNPLHRGFDWFSNYWCDLIARNGWNGSPNPGRFIGLAAMMVLFSSLSVFWFLLPEVFRETRFTRVAIGYTGFAAMLISFFVFTRYHDEVVFAGGILSAVPLAGTLWELHIHQWRKLFLLGLFSGGLILLNFLMFLSGWQIHLLPFIQKITLLLFLIWVFAVDWHCLKKMRSITGSS